MDSMRRVDAFGASSNRPPCTRTLFNVVTPNWASVLHYTSNVWVASWGSLGARSFRGGSRRPARLP